MRLPKKTKAAGEAQPDHRARRTARRRSHDDRPGSIKPACRQPRCPDFRGTGGFASPPYDGFALRFRDAVRLKGAHRGRCTSTVERFGRLGCKCLDLATCESDYTPRRHRRRCCYIRCAAGRANARRDVRSFLTREDQRGASCGAPSAPATSATIRTSGSGARSNARQSRPDCRARPESGSGSPGYCLRPREARLAGDCLGFHQ